MEVAGEATSRLGTSGVKPKGSPARITETRVDPHSVAFNHEEVKKGATSVTEDVTVVAPEPSIVRVPPESIRQW